MWGCSKNIGSWKFIQTCRSRKAALKLACRAPVGACLQGDRELIAITAPIGTKYIWVELLGGSFEDETEVILANINLSITYKND